MPTPTYTLIDSVTLATTAASVTFSGISATGKGDLILVSNAFGGAGNVRPEVRLNSDSGSNYPLVRALGLGASTSTFAGTRTAMRFENNTADATNSVMSVLQLFDYSATDKHKSALHRHGSPNVVTSVGMTAHRWANTDAVTTVSIHEDNPNGLGAGSTFHLYQLVSE